MKNNLLKENNSRKRKESLYLSFFIFLTVFFLSTIIIFCNLYMKLISKKSLSIRNLKEKLNASTDDDRYIPVISQISLEDGAYIKRRKQDIPNSKYFKYFDIYNTKSSGSLILLEKFKTYQQTSEYSCGIASLIMAVNYIDGTVLNETEMAIRANSNPQTGTFIDNLVKLVDELGYEYETKTSFTEDDCPTRNDESFKDYIQESLKNQTPIIVISNDWGGHYSVIIGYDDMGTEDYIEDDIIILADPYDTTDHMNDGYTIFSYERYYSQMTLKVFGIENQDLNFIRLKKKNQISN